MYEYNRLVLTKHYLLLFNTGVEATHNVVWSYVKNARMYCYLVIYRYLLLLHVFGPFMKFLVTNSEYIFIYFCNNDVVHVYSYVIIQTMFVLIILSGLLFAIMGIILLYVNNIV